MKSHRLATRVLAGVLPATALFATPAPAQLETQTAPPPVPQGTAPAPAPTAVTPSSEPNRAQYDASLRAATGRTEADAADAPAATSARATRAPAAPARRAAVPRPAAAAVTPSPTPPSATPPDSPAPAASPSPAASAVPATEPTATPTSGAVDTRPTAGNGGGLPTWGWLVIGLAVIAALVGGALALRRRRSRDEWAEEQVHYEPEPAAIDHAIAAVPLAADPPVAERAEVVAPEVAEVAAITDGAVPVAGRPWIELSLRPVRAGVTDASALVDLELTLANAGEFAAADVRVATCMLADAADAPTDLAQLRAAGHAGTEVDAGAIAAGEGARVDARLAVPFAGTDGMIVRPVVVADVRYRLPGGGEGRTAAAFTIGAADGTDGPAPLPLGGDLREDLTATLHGVPERA